MFPVLRPPASECAETVILNVILNGETKGEFFVSLAEDGDVLVRVFDLKAAGFQDPAGSVVVIDGEPHLSLRSMEGVSFTLDERTLSLDVTADPSLLPKSTIDFAPRRQAKIYYPKDSSGFFNYGLIHTAGDSFAFRSFDATGQVGARTGDILVLSDFSYGKTEFEERLVRLATSMTIDRRDRLQRLVLGDFFASSGELGSNLTMGGLSVSKVYRMDPYFIRYPLADVSGLVSLPSEVEIYLDGTRIRTEKLSPGAFELRNIASFGGAGVVTLLVRDAFGREQRLVFPFYFTDFLLKKGLHEYSYNIGILREEFGLESNEYGDAAFSAFHRYGLSDFVTLGFRSEGAAGRFNFGPQVLFRTGKAGIATASLSGSHDDGSGGGLAGLLSHVYQSRSISTRIFLSARSRDYATAAAGGRPEGIRFEAGAGAGYGTRTVGSLSLDFTAAERHDGSDRRAAAVTYSRNVRRNVALLLSFRRILEETSTGEFFIGMTYHPWMDVSLSAGYKRTGDADTETVQVLKNTPVGEGYGFRATLERTDSPAASATVVNPFLQYNARYGVYSGEYRGLFHDGGRSDGSYRLSAAGGVAYVAGAWGLSRPISDSFGLVRVGNLEGVRVLRNNQEIGRTDASGKVFVPDLGSYYENQISVADKDVPIDYSLREVVKHVSPPLRSGSLIFFEAKRLQAVTGTVSLERDGEAVPAEYVEVKATIDAREIAFPTGRGGEFYLEDVGPGTHAAWIEAGGRTCVFDMKVPETDEMIVDLGGLACEDVR